MTTAFTASCGTLHKKLTGTVMLGVTLLGLAACQTAPAPASGPANTGSSTATTPQSGKTVGMANPASVHCINAGGKLEIRTDTSGGQYGVCHLPDGNSCEEWSFLRTGQCKAETLKNR